MLIGIAIVLWFSVGAFLAPLSYQWWMHHYNSRSTAIICAFLTFVAPPSFLWEALHWNDK